MAAPRTPISVLLTLIIGVSIASEKRPSEGGAWLLCVPEAGRDGLARRHAPWKAALRVL